MSMVFREFQGLTSSANLKQKQIFSSFWGQKSRLIMRYYPLPEQILQLGETGLQQLAELEGIRFKDYETSLLLQAAERALAAPSREWAQFQSEQVKFRLQQLETLEEQIAALELKIEEMLVKSPAVLLLSIKGISVITAAEFIAEVGSFFNYTYNRQIIKLAGINPVLSQSGGKKAKAYQISRQGNPALRYIVTLIGKNLCNKKCRNTYFLNYYDRLAQRGKTPCQIYNAAANKFIRIAFAMLQNQTLFYVPGFEDSTSDIFCKFSIKKNRQAAEQALELLSATANLKDRLLCS
jgi:hypothetical protein